MTEAPASNTDRAGRSQSRNRVLERLGPTLVERELLTADALEELEHRVKWLNEPMDRIIAREALVPEEELLDILSELSGIPLIRLAETRVDDEAVKKVPTRVAAHYEVMPIRLEPGVLTLAACRVPDLKEEDHLRVLLNCSLRWSLTRKREISECVKHYYGVGIETYIRAGLAGGEAAPTGAGESVDGETNSHVLAFVRRVIEDAIQSDATDVHFEPYEDRLRLRYRIDGVLYPVPLPAGADNYQRAIMSSIKVMAQLNIAEKRLPQDGGFTFEADNRSFDIRVSVLPSRHGETVNLRILNRTTVFLSMEELGLRPEQLATMQEIVSQPYGVVLFTGATGSGKTTSLYAALAWLNDSERKIITIEDPVEYQLSGITQIQVLPQIGLTFAAGLRSVLRHDPDVILIGEIRDDETARIAVSAAMTGHMVFSTLHTNESASGLLRLVEMGVEPYLVSSSVQAIVAQRLVRRICRTCKQPAGISEGALEQIRARNPEVPGNAEFFKGAGCADCRFTGYSGRKAVFEIMNMTDEIRALVVERASSTAILNRAIEQGLETLRQGAWRYAMEGVTTVDDVLRVTRR